MLKDDPHGAVRHYRRACDLAPEHPTVYACLAAAQAMGGNIEASDRTLATAFGRFGEAAVSPYALAIVATRSCRFDQAFALLDSAIDRRDPSIMMLGTDPSFAALHTDRRWEPLLKRRVPSADR